MVDRHNKLTKWSRKHKKDINVFHYNIGYLRTRYDELLLLLKDNIEVFDIIILSDVSINQVEKNLYNVDDSFVMYHSLREIRRGGGIIILVKSHLKQNMLCKNIFGV